MENLKLNDGDSSSSHREAKFKMERKPDFENESLRMWVPSNKEKRHYRKTDARIKYKGYTFGLVGFTVAKAKGKVVFAFKFKPENKTVLAYKDEKNHEAEAIYNDLREYAQLIGYQFSDVRDTWERILMEEHTIRKLAGKDDREGQLTNEEAVTLRTKFVVIENQYGNFYFSVIEAENLEDAYEQAETMVSSPWLHYVVPLNELRDFVLNYFEAHKTMKGGD